MVTTTETEAEKKLLQTVLIQAIKDYMAGHEQVTKGNKIAIKGRRIVRNGNSILTSGKLAKKGVKKFVKKMNKTFCACATALDTSPDALQELMYSKMDAIDKGEELEIKKLKI